MRKKNKKKNKLKLPSLKGKSKIKEGERLSKSRKSKRNFNQGKVQQKSILEKRLSYKHDFWYPL